MRPIIRIARSIPGRMRRSLSDTRQVASRAIRGPSRERDLAAQSFKAAAAAVLAWLIAGEWTEAPLSFIAPWVALLMVDATVYRSVIKGVQQVMAVVLGLLAATGAYTVIGNRTVSLALVLVPVMLLANWRRFGDQGTTGAVTALFVLTSGNPGIGEFVARLMETALGVVVGVTVNALVFPPTHLRSAHAATARIADEVAGLLEQVADGLRDGDWNIEDARDWLRRGDGVQRLVGDAWSAIGWGQESVHLLPWRRRKHREADLTHVLLPLEVVAKQTQGICRATVDAATEGMPSPDPSFISFYAEILAHGATIVRAYRGRHFGPAPPEPPQIVEAARQRNHELHERLRQRASSDDAWLIHGSLIIEVDRLLAGLAASLQEQPARAPRSRPGAQEESGS
ncbi:aromatic acid exporter family protein [Spirillospora sp. NPDC048819]|uniref:FUSC family protein n=1 Tax=Spirillospora sp. NPDC048819 TaxID=3155268 RepID=UPI00340F853C